VRSSKQPIITDIMSTWLGSWFGGKRASPEAARNAIVTLRQHLMMLERKEEHLNSKIEEETKKAKANVSTNKRVATSALRQKKMYESELLKLESRRMTLEQEVNAIESANMNMETMKAMKQGAEALKGIHGNLNIDKVDATMDSIREQMDLGNEISEAISQPNLGPALDEDELARELEELEQENLDEALIGAGGVPTHLPSLPTEKVATKAPPSRSREEEEEEDELRQLQAAMAM